MFSNVSSLQGTGSALATVPNALVRWTEESRVLDGDSLHDCMTACKPEILEVGNILDLLQAWSLGSL